MKITLEETGILLILEDTYNKLKIFKNGIS